MITVARVYDYHPSKIRLLSEALLPLLSELRAAHNLPVAFCTRGWDGGSHLALHLAGPGLDQAVFDDLSRRLAAAAAANPAETWTEAEYTAIAERNSRLEGRTGFRPRPAPHGTVSIDTMPDDGPLAEQRRAYHTGMAEVLRDTLVPGHAPSRVSGLGLGLLVATAAVYPGGLRFGSLSLRSHAEAFLAVRPDGERLRQQFEQAYRQNRAAALQLVETGVRSASSLPGNRLAEQTYAVLRSAEHAADIRRLTAPGQRRGQPAPTSQFHATLRQFAFWDNPPIGFNEYRVLINWLYEALPLLDVQPAARYLSCHLIACAVDEFLGESWQQRIAQRTA
ncbi:hypothetical protein ACIRYZ_10670 [Kitasatospora sp. NPDC101155]|uniref:hypothetical protein n=1 Tax=Kitasatospora sp. NPDC101155 TaxID=3364097 RepID=UPI0038278D55